METWKRILLILLLVVLSIVALPLLFPLLIGGFIASRINTRQFKQQYREFLSGCDNMIFFCYTNRNQVHQVIEEHILPHLSPTINVIFWEGSEPHSDFNTRFISHMLYHIKNAGAPTLIRVTNGQVIDVSLQKDLQLILDQEGDPASFVKVLQDKVEVLQSTDVAEPDMQPDEAKVS